MPALGKGHVMDDNLPVPSEEPPGPFEDEHDFFPEKVPQWYSGGTWKRDREAARLKAVGHSLEEIAEMLQLEDRYRPGEYDPRRAARAVQRGLTAVYRFSKDETKLQELQSLDEMERHLWTSLRKEHVLVQQGRVIMIDGQTVKDERFVLETLDRILKIKERRAKYLGLDETVRVSVEADQIGSEIGQLIAAINATDDAVRDLLPSASAHD